MAPMISEHQPPSPPKRPPSGSTSRPRDTPPSSVEGKPPLLDSKLVRSSAFHGSLLPLAEDERGAARREYRARFVRAGRIAARGGQPGRFIIPPEALAQAVQQGHFNAKPCFIDHPGLFQGASLRDLAAVTLDDASYDAFQETVDGTIRLYESPAGDVIKDLFDTLLQDRDEGEPVPNVGISMVFWPRWKEQEEPSQTLEVQEIVYIESVDFVFGPAADGRVLEALSVLSQGGTSMSAEITPTEAPEAPDIAPSPPPPVEAPAPTSPSPAADAEDWQAAMQRAAVPTILAGSTLPTVARERLAARVFPTPQELQQAIEDELQYLAALAEDQVIQIGGSPPRGTRISVGPTPLDQMQAAMDWVFGVEDAKLPPPDLRRTDRLYYLLTGDGMWNGVFNEAEALATANPTTLPGLAVNAMNKVIVPLYDRLESYRWYEQLVVVSPTDGTLHDMAWIQFGGMANLPVVADGAAYTELTVGDSKETAGFTKYGGYVGITDKMLRNSDIARIQAIPRALVVAAIQTRSAAIAGIFTSNAGVGPTLGQDSTALFHTDHGNLDTTAYSWTAWKAARLECAKAAELTSAKRTMMWPRFWLGPADLYDDALADFGYGAGPGGRPATADYHVNPYAQDRPGDPRPIPIAIPEFTDTNDWAYLADPALTPVLHMAYADSPGGGSHPAPQLFTVTSKLAGLMFTNDVLPIKIRDFWAYGVSGYRGIGKRNVT